ncbi:MAG: inorganic diphosphatase [Burkholderiales bacterium]
MLSALAPFGSDGAVRVIVESPRHSTLKYEYDPALDAFRVARQLSLGLAYPHDWGFVPGTRAEDGDPADALVLHATATYPGILLDCLPLGLITVRERKKRKWISNHRLVLRPAWDGATPGVDKIGALPRQAVRELEQFFVNAAFFTGKQMSVTGWRGPREAIDFVRRCADEA